MLTCWQLCVGLGFLDILHRKVAEEGSFVFILHYIFHRPIFETQLSSSIINWAFIKELFCLKSQLLALILPVHWRTERRTPMKLHRVLENIRKNRKIKRTLLEQVQKELVILDQFFNRFFPKIFKQFLEVGSSLQPPKP